MSITSVTLFLFLHLFSLIQAYNPEDRYTASCGTTGRFSEATDVHSNSSIIFHNFDRIVELQRRLTANHEYRLVNTISPSPPLHTAPSIHPR
ncbi:hypothetical protein Fmac_016624 [Flemingia macrophylla]|uniref:Uncharacterized protein n=1 Tax=Flemingia macrophylla TaxID=520843 RepID=A0ABD1MHW1_9FABA